MMSNYQNTKTNEIDLVLFEGGVGGGVGAGRGGGGSSSHPSWVSTVSACILYTAYAQNPN